MKSEPTKRPKREKRRDIHMNVSKKEHLKDKSLLLNEYEEGKIEKKEEAIIRKCQKANLFKHKRRRDSELVESICIDLEQNEDASGRNDGYCYSKMKSLIV